MDLNRVCEELANAARGVACSPRLNALPFLPDSPPNPCFYVAEVEAVFDQAMRSGAARGDSRVTIVCRVVVSRGDDASSQKWLFNLMAPTGAASLWQALDSARGGPGQAALNGACDDFHVQSLRPLVGVPHGDSVLLGAEIVLLVIGDGD